MARISAHVDCTMGKGGSPYATIRRWLTLQLASIPCFGRHGNGNRENAPCCRDGKVRDKRLIDLLLPIGIGLAIFFTIVGPRVLRPDNLAWLVHSDQAQAYLGWAMYRQAPWSFPVGLNPAYGMELSNSIVYSDSIPLLAIPLKAIEPLLPQPFQYFGIWFLLCFSLQALFSWRLASIATESVASRVLVVLLFLLAPPMLARLGVHMALTGHFLILAALYLALAPKSHGHRLAWAVALVASALVHAYLLAMVAALWTASLVDRSLRRDAPAKRIAIEVAITALVVGIAMWQAGYFTVYEGIVGKGYGQFRMNLLSPIDSSGWSYVLRDFPEGAGDYEGFNFLGLGALFLVVSAASLALSGVPGLGAALKRHSVLLCALVGMALFSLSNNIGVGAQSLVVDVPTWAQRAASLLRASGRLFWPVFYAMIFLSVWIVCRSLRPRAAFVFLAVAVMLQLVDTSAAWLDLRTSLMRQPAPRFETGLRDDFWTQAAKTYKKVVWMPPEALSPKWLPVAAFAAENGLTTNAVYLARMDQSAIDAALERAYEKISSGSFSNDTLYVLDDSLVLAAALSANPMVDLLAKVDGLTVLAPRWKECVRCRSDVSEVHLKDLLPARVDARRFAVGSGAEGNVFLSFGWSKREDWGVWSDGSRAEVVVPNSGRLSSVVLEGRALIAPPRVPAQRVAVSVNDMAVAGVLLRESDDAQITVRIPEAIRMDANAHPILRIVLTFPDAARPSSLGLSDDPRLLGFGLRYVSLEESEPARVR